MSTVLVINAGWEQRPLIDAARKVATRLIAVHPSADVADDLPVDRLAVMDLRDTAKILKLAREEKIDAVITDECDYSAFSAALVAEALQLPGAGIGPAGRAVNKALQRDAIAAAGIRQPQYAVCANVDEARTAAREIGYPLVVKPVDSRGGLGVRFVHQESELADAVINAIGNSISWQIIVEQCIEGTQFVVDGYVFPRAGYQALAVSSKRMVPGTPVAADIISPAEADPEVINAVRAYDAKIVAALGLRSGMTHGEYMVNTAGEVYLVEVANRGGGVWISAKYVPAICGVDTTAQLVEDALGTGRDLFEQSGGVKQRAGRVHFLIPPADQALIGVVGEDAARALPGVECLWVKPIDAGRIASTMQTDLDRQGMAILSGDTTSAVDAVLAQLQQTLMFQTGKSA